MQILFNKTIEQCRQLGARGGRAYARNLRLRRSQASVPPVAPLPAQLNDFECGVPAKSSLHGQPILISNPRVRRIDAERSRKGNQVILFLDKDTAEAFGNRKLI
jgi:hypothetical protein